MFNDSLLVLDIIIELFDVFDLFHGKMVINLHFVLFDLSEVTFSSRARDWEERRMHQIDKTEAN